MTGGCGAATERRDELDAGIGMSDQTTTRAFFDIVLGAETIGADLIQVRPVQVRGKPPRKVKEEASFEPGKASAATAWVHRGRGGPKTRLQVGSYGEPECGVALLLPRSAAVSLLVTRIPPTLVILPIGINNAIALWLLTTANVHRHYDAGRALEKRFGGRPLEGLPIPGRAEADPAGWHGSSFIEVTGRPWNACDIIEA